MRRKFLTTPAVTFRCILEVRVTGEKKIKTEFDKFSKRIIVFDCLYRKRTAPCDLSISFQSETLWDVSG